MMVMMAMQMMIVTMKITMSMTMKCSTVRAAVLTASPMQ